MAEQFECQICGKMSDRLHYIIVNTPTGGIRGYSGCIYCRWVQDRLTNTTEAIREKSLELREQSESRSPGEHPN
jgi:hypothetical protein